MKFITQNMEKTFEELIDQYSYRGNYINSEKVVGEESVLELMQQVRESTGNEFLKALEGVDLPMVTTMKIMAIMTATDRIKIEP